MDFWLACTALFVMVLLTLIGIRFWLPLAQLFSLLIGLTSVAAFMLTGGITMLSAGETIGLGDMSVFLLVFILLTVMNLVTMWSGMK